MNLRSFIRRLLTMKLQRTHTRDREHLALTQTQPECSVHRIV